MNHPEIPLVFECANCRLVGIAAIPEKPLAVAVLMVVGGPQYRCGSHRQFTLLARDLAREGIPSLRFDYRGMGDSEGSPRNFETVDDDIRSAVDALLGATQNIRQIVIWGLCDAASAALYYTHTDPRVTGLVLLNPWVHSEAGAGRARIKHYYVSRFAQRSFWAKLFSGKVKTSASVTEFLQSIRYYFANRNQQPLPQDNALTAPSSSYIDRMLAGFKRYPGPVLFILSGNDLTAQEFQDLTRTSAAWKAAYASSQVEQRLLPDANHTFSTRLQRDQASLITRLWILQHHGHADP